MSTQSVSTTSGQPTRRSGRRLLYLYDGRWLTLDQLTNESPVCRRSIEARLHRGWPTEWAVRLPADEVLLNGVPTKLLAIARAEGVSVNTLRAHLAGELEAAPAVAAVRAGRTAGEPADSRSRRAKPRRLVVYQGRTWTVAELARHAGLKYITLSMRLRKGWPVERAVAQDVHRWAKHEYRGRQMTIRQIAAEARVPYALLSGRLARGMSPEEAVADIAAGGKPLDGVRAVTVDGRLVTVSELARRTGISYATLVRRLFRDGLSVEDATRRTGHDHARYTLNGRPVSITRFADELGVCMSTVYRHLRAGWPLERIAREYGPGAHAGEAGR